MAKRPEPSVSPKEQRALTRVAVFGGAATIVAYPAALVTPPGLMLGFVVPMSLVAVGRLRQQRVLELAGGLGVLAILVGGIVVGVGWLVALVLILAPLAVLIAVLGHLSSVDRPAARAWRRGTSLGLLAGYGFTLLLARPAIGVAVAIPCLAIGAVVADQRLHRGEPTRGGRRTRERRRGG